MVKSPSGSPRPSASIGGLVPIRVFKAYQRFSFTCVVVVILYCSCTVVGVYFKRSPGQSHSLQLDKADKHEANQERNHGQQDIDGNGVAGKYFECESVERRLCEVANARETDYEPIHFAEGLKAEDFGGVVRYGGIIERSVDDKECNVGVAGAEAVWNTAYYSDGCCHRNE